MSSVFNKIVVQLVGWDHKINSTVTDLMSVNDSPLWTLIAIIIVIPSAADQFNTTIRTWTCNSAIKSTFLSTGKEKRLNISEEYNWFPSILIVPHWPSFSWGYDFSPFFYPIPMSHTKLWIVSSPPCLLYPPISIRTSCSSSFYNQSIHLPLSRCPTVQRIEYTAYVTSPGWSSSCGRAATQKRNFVIVPATFACKNRRQTPRSWIEKRETMRFCQRQS